MHEKKLILFDLDGVLIDSKLNMKIAWDAVQKTHGISTEFEKYFSKIGLPFSDILRKLKIEYSVDIETTYRTASANNLHLVDFFPGVLNVLLILEERGIKVGVVTSKDSLRTDSILSRLPVNFETIQTPNSMYRGKPSPDHLLIAMAEANIDPSETLYIGDMAVDFMAANRANVDYVHANWGYEFCDDSRCNAINKINNILDYL